MTGGPRKQLLHHPIAVLDTETTGLPCDEWAEVIEFGAVLIDVYGQEVANIFSLCKPDVLDARANGALAVNCITPAMLVSQPSPAVVAEEFIEWMALHRWPRVTSYNVEFDREMVWRLLRTRVGLPEPAWAPCIMLEAWRRMDEGGAPMERWPSGEARWPRLSAAAEWFGVEVVGDPHRALTDARTAAGVLLAMLRRDADG